MHNKLYQINNVMAGKAKESSLSLVYLGSWGTVIPVKWTKNYIVCIYFRLYF
jgi:hypothetical protein